MTDKRAPSSGPYKQVFYPWIRWPAKYTTCKMGRDDYMETEVWKMLSRRRMEMDKRTCQDCGTAQQLQVHHIRYPEVWGEERMEDLITLCDSCHAKLHENDIVKEKLA